MEARSTNATQSRKGVSSRELTQEEVFLLLEQAASEDHPNLDRLGCPSAETLEAFALNPLGFPMSDPIFDHLQNCSPCFRFVQARRA